MSRWVAGGIAGLILSLGFAVYATDLNFSRMVESGGGIGDGITPATGDILTGGFDVSNSTALTGDNQGTAAHEALGGSSSPWATTAGKKIGGASIYRGGLGTKNGTLTNANCGTATITIGWTDSTGTAYTQPFIEATHWAKGATDASAATALAAAITAGTGGASTPAGHTTAEVMSATAVANVVGLVEKPGKAVSMNFTGDGAGACAAEVNGADGRILAAAIYDSTAVGPAYGFLNDPSTGIGPYSTAYPTGEMCLYISGACRAEITSGQFNASLALVTSSSSGVNATAGPVSAKTSIFSGKSYLPTVSAVATDAAPVATVITTEEPYAATPPTTVPTNSAGSNLVLAPANGGRRLGGTAVTGMCTATPCVFANGQTITIPVQVDGVSTNCVLTSAAATDAPTRAFACDGLTPAVCGANVVTAGSTVSPCSLMTITAANNVVSFARKSGSASYLGAVVSSAGGITVQNGADGSWKAPVRVVAGANTACNTTCGAGRGCLFGQDTAALTYAIVDCANATADLCLCTAAQ